MKKSHDTGPMADLRRAAREAAKRLQERADNRVVQKPHDLKKSKSNRNDAPRLSGRAIKRMLDVRAQAGA
jgi:hypothetical protein